MNLMGLLTKLTVVFFITTLTCSAAYIETMSFNKMSFDFTYNFQNYRTIKQQKQTLPIHELKKADRYTLKMNLNIKTKGQFYFWNEQLKTGLHTPYLPGVKYSLESFMPSILK